MNTNELFENYPTNETYMAAYIAYQKAYASTIRESDRVLLDIVADELSSFPDGRRPQLLDIGCSTGSLLVHLRRAFPALALTGGDLSPSSIAAAMAEPELADATLEMMDILRLGEDGRHWDIIVANAILYGFDDDLFEKALTAIGRSLSPNGLFVAFDFCHPFPQDLTIVERSPAFPDGHPLHFRSSSTMTNALTAAGLTDSDIRTFEIPIDLPLSVEDPLRSRTIDADGRRLLFRGALAQPWCHIVARRG